MEKISAELFIVIVVNLLTVAFFAGIYVQTQKQLKENFEALKERVVRKTDEMQQHFSDKLKDLKENFHEKMDAIERKQDKHNNLIERMAKVEASASSAHKRINMISGEGYDER